MPLSFLGKSNHGAFGMQINQNTLLISKGKKKSESPHRALENGVLNEDLPEGDGVREEGTSVGQPVVVHRLAGEDVLPEVHHARTHPTHQPYTTCTTYRGYRRQY